MPRPARDEEREQRIAMEIIVDAYSADEQTRQAIEDWHYWVALGHEL